jgi:hypothetical protein
MLGTFLRSTAVKSDRFKTSNSAFRLDPPVERLRQAPFFKRKVLEF